MSDTNKPHSADYFGEYRNFWWNKDFLALMGKRLNFAQVQNVLDVGCGVGHWGKALASALPVATTIIGVDREDVWVKKANEWSVSKKLEHKFKYKQGDVNNLPFSDASFDMATCQTVLIHLADPEQALREMLRVLKPGGLLLAVEPSNIANELSFSSISAEAPIDELVDRYRFALTCHRGRRSQGAGFLSIGDLLPGMFAKLQVSDIKVYLSDKAMPVFPPYAGEEQQALIKQVTAWGQEDVYIANKEETKKFFLAGGGVEDEFEKLWSLILKEGRELPKHIASKAFHCGGLAVQYLVSAIKIKQTVVANIFYS